MRNQAEMPATSAYVVAGTSPSGSNEANMAPTRRVSVPNGRGETDCRRDKSYGVIKGEIGRSEGLCACGAKGGVD